jgi:cyclase
VLKKRIIGVVTVKDGWAVQSIGYKKYLPLGHPERLVENLDRWGADEILLQVIDRSKDGSGPDFKMLDRIAKLGLGTPLIYGGGIRTVRDGITAIQCGADRLVLDALLVDASMIVCKLSESLGAQALIGATPMQIHKGEGHYMNYRDRSVTVMPPSILELIKDASISELLLIDAENEGRDNSFDTQLVEDFPNQNIPLILFGGISNASQMRQMLQIKNVAAVAIGNFLNYREHAIQNFKEDLGTASLRAPIYQSDHQVN